LIKSDYYTFKKSLDISFNNLVFLLKRLYDKLRTCGIPTTSGIQTTRGLQKNKKSFINYNEKKSLTNFAKSVAIS